MDENIFDFTVDTIDTGLDSESFTELAMSINALEAYRESTTWLIEAVNDPVVNRKGSFRKAAENTKDIADKSGKVLGAVVDAKAGVYHAEANLILKIAGHIAKIIKFMAGKVEKLVNSISNLGSKITSIPENIRNQIKGSINIYITVGDIQMIYNTSIINKIDSFVSQFDVLTSGDAWSTFFSFRNTEIDGLKFSTNDIKICKQLHKTAIDMKNVTFDLTVVPMDDPKNRAAYFSAEKLIHFTDLHGVNHDCCYHEALMVLVSDLCARKKAIEDLQKAFGEKMNKTELNQSWAMLGRHNQETITGAMNDAATVLSIVGNLCKYIYEDISTLNKSAEKIMNKFEKPKAVKGPTKVR